LVCGVGLFVYGLLNFESELRVIGRNRWRSQTQTSIGAAMVVAGYLLRPT